MILYDDITRLPVLNTYKLGTSVMNQYTTNWTSNNWHINNWNMNDIETYDPDEVIQSNERTLPKMRTNETPCTYSVICDQITEFDSNNILKNISTMKGRLMLDCAIIPLKEIQCLMTPGVKQILVKASKRLAMYGKTCPYRARFDEFGNPLPDEINIGYGKGMTLKIVDPASYGEYYLELKGVFTKRRKN